MAPQEQVSQSIFRTKPNASEIKAIKEWFAGTENQKGYYENTGVLYSLFDLYLNNNQKNTDKPVIKIQGINQNTTFIKDLREISQSIDQNKRDVIYIRRRPVELRQRENHWVVFYFFADKNRKKNLLFIDTQTPNIGQQSKFQKDIESFKTEQNSNLYVSSTEVQKDDNSCGLIASEITRMLYSNHESVKENLSKCQVQDREKVELSSLPLGNEFQRLKSACTTKGNVNYDGKDEEFHAADIRAAHSKIGLGILRKKLDSLLYNNTYDNEKTNDVKELVDNIRSEFKLEASSDPGYSSSSEPNSPQLERNHPLKTPKTSSGQNVNLESEIKKQKQEIERLKDLLYKENACRLKFEKEKKEAFDRASKNAQELEKTKQQLSASEEIVEQFTQSLNSLETKLKSYEKMKDDLNAQLTTKDQELNDAKQNLNEVTQLTEENVRLRAQNQDLNNKNKKFSEASAQGRQQNNYASVAFVVAGTFAVVASLTMPYLAVCTTLAIAASIFFAVGCYSLYKANTTLSNAEVNQATSSAGLTATQ